MGEHTTSCAPVKGVDSPIERVAKAMHDADWRQQIGTNDGAPRSWETNPQQEWWRTMARAAIAAMREPTAAMINAGGDAMPAAEGYDLHADCVRPWRAMIDAVLAEARP